MTPRLQVRRLCDWDKSIYDAGKGVKTDLQRHHVTGCWPFAVTVEDLEQALGDGSGESKRMKQPRRDAELCQAIAAFWRRVFLGAPAWASACALGQAAAIQKPAKRPRLAAEGRSDSGNDRESQHVSELVLLALAALSPTVGCSYDKWCQVFFAVLNALGDRELAIDAFNQWSSAAEGYKGRDDVVRLLGNASVRSGPQRLDVGHLVRWAHKSPALVLLAPRDHRARAQEPATANALLERCDLARSSWRFVVRAAACLFPDERGPVVDAVSRSVGVSADEAMRVWNYATACSEAYRSALGQYLAAKAAGVDALFDRHLGAWLRESSGEDVFPSYAAAHDVVGFWTVSGLSAASHAYELDLSRLTVSECPGGKRVKDVFPLSAFFVRDDGPTGAISLAENLARSLPAASPIRFDLEEKRWRHYDAELGVWALSDGVRREVGPSSGPPRFFDPLHALAGCIRAQALPLLEIARFLAERGDDDESPRKKAMRRRVGEVCRFIESFCESHHMLAKLLDSLASCDSMASHFDQQPPHMLCCPNGVVDLRSGALIALTPENSEWVRSLEFTEEQFCVTPHAGSQASTTAAADSIRAFLLEHLFPPDVYPEAEAVLDAMQLWLGYRLTGETNLHQAWQLTGEGANMKSLLSTWLFETLGPLFVAMLAAKDLNFKPSDNNDAIFHSRRKRAWNVNESGTRNQWDEETFKGLTGGEPRRGVSAKYKNEVRFQPVAKMVAFVNELPQFTTPDAFALQRRCVVVPLRVCYVSSDAERQKLLEREIGAEWIREADPNFYREQMAPRKQQFLAWLVEGAVRFYRSGQKLRVPASLQGQNAFRGQSEAESDVEAFLAGSLEHAPGSRLPVAWIREVFLSECQMDPAELTMRSFCKLCRDVCTRRFPKAYYNRAAKVKVGNLTEKQVLPCIVDVFWVDTKLPEIDRRQWRVH